MRTAREVNAPQPFSDILDEALQHIVRHEDPLRLIDWLFARLDDADARGVFGIHAGEEIAPLAHTLGRALWNATPLPGNGFRPMPLPAPGRNDPCFCGSGRKFKRCCGRLTPPPIDTKIAWTLLLNRLPAATRRAAIRSGQAPIHALIGLALEHHEDGKPKKALELVEPLFEGTPHGHGEDHDEALNLVCNLYDDLGFHKKKMALLDRIVSDTRRSPLRSGALQRLAAIRLDGGDPAGAWAAFKAAQRDDPKSPSLGLLEVQMLIAEGRGNMARERARFWLRQLKRTSRPDELEGPIAFLKAVAENPERAMADIAFDMAGDAGRALSNWLNEVSPRPLPDYRISADEPVLPEGAGDGRDTELARHLRQQGVASDDIARVIAQLNAQLAGLEAEAERAAGDDEAPAEDPQEVAFLQAPQPVLALEASWQAVFPLGKPFSVNLRPFGEEGVWDDEDLWVAYLDAHREAFDSLDILDDLATAVECHPQRDVAGVAEALQEPLLRRAHAIIDRALAASEMDHPKLRWSWTENRPAVRSLVRLVYLELHRGNNAAALTLAQQVLALNPDDNHGLRTLVINALLRAGDDEAALQLARAYPEDANPEIAYGEVLALYRLGRKGEALLALEDAIQALPKLPRFLTAAKVRKPRIDAFGVRMGGDDQAWIYRQEMRDVWQATPGMLQWLKQAARRHR